MLTTNLSTLIVPSLSETLKVTGQPALPATLLTPSAQAKTTTHDGRSYARSELGLLLPA